MARIIFQVSRARFSQIADAEGNQVKTITQLRLKERYNSQREQITSMATLHFKDLFLSGMHYCYVDENGERYYSFNKADGVDFKVDFKINFEEKHLKSVLKQVVKMGDKLTAPPKDEDGVSQLRGVQLHVVLIPGAELGLNNKQDEKWGDRLQQKVQSYSIEKVELVTAADAEYVQSPDTTTLAADLAIQAIYQVTRKEEAKKPESPQEAKAAILGIMSKSSRPASRQAARGTKAIQPQNSSIVLSDDEDEEQPE